MTVSFTMQSPSAILATRGLAKNGRVAQLLASEVLRRCTPYVPRRTGYLASSGAVVGSNVVYSAPHAKAQYYAKRKTGGAGGSLTGPHWFERMLAAEKSALVSYVASAAGGHT